VSLAALARRCLFPGFEGVAPPDWVRREVADGLGGVVLFARNVRAREQVAALTRALRAERDDVVVATDEEGGDVTRLEAASGSSYPGACALGAVDDVALTERVAQAMGSELAAVGIDLDLAPVADVNSNPLNPVIGVRSFGSDSELVARHVAAFVSGLQAAGVSACTKHFPGHGDTDVDSHLALPVAGGNLAEALRPFHAAIGAGTRAIMTAHIVVPALGELPATLNRGALEDLLRGDLGFDSVVMTDALEMQGVSALFSPEEAAVRALDAGADALCLGHDLGADGVGRFVDAIVAAVRSRRLREERLLQAAERIEHLARASNRLLLAREDPGVGLEAARRAVLSEGRVELARPPLVVELLPQPSIAAGKTGVGLAELLRDADVARGAAAGELDGRQLVLVVRDAHRYGWQRDAVEAAGADAVVVETGIPLWRPSCARGYVATRGGGRANLAAAAELLQPLRQ
jgi:beta-N-acetylhexosaminidase